MSVRSQTCFLTKLLLESEPLVCFEKKFAEGGNYPPKISVWTHHVGGWLVLVKKIENTNPIYFMGEYSSES